MLVNWGCLCSAWCGAYSSIEKHWARSPPSPAVEGRPSCVVCQAGRAVLSAASNLGNVVHVQQTRDILPHGGVVIPAEPPLGTTTPRHPNREPVVQLRCKRRLRDGPR
jgi:hypothetical protein